MTGDKKQDKTYQNGKDLSEIVFVFEDGKRLVLKEDALRKFEAICCLKSDYLLPRHETDFLGATPLVAGFFKNEANKRPEVRVLGVGAIG